MKWCLGAWSGLEAVWSWRHNCLPGPASCCAWSCRVLWPFCCHWASDVGFVGETFHSHLLLHSYSCYSADCLFSMGKLTRAPKLGSDWKLPTTKWLSEAAHKGSTNESYASDEWLSWTSLGVEGRLRDCCLVRAVIATNDAATSADHPDYCFWLPRPALHCS